VDRGAAWVFHSGALGDFVLTWPLLRSLRVSGRGVVVVARGGHARLAAAELGVIGIDAEARRFTRLWAGDGGQEEERVRDASLVLTFLADPVTESGRVWAQGAAAMFPDAEIVYIGPPASLSRTHAWERFEVAEHGIVSWRANAGGPVVVHVGAGSREKMWAMERWREVVESLRGDGRDVRVLAGEVEMERLTAQERSAFAAMGGEFCEDLGALAASLRPASLVIGCDTGPTHLAAQLGVTTVALFGPTDPAVWAPRGPRVRVIAPDRPMPMAWLTVERVLREAALA